MHRATGFAWTAVAFVLGFWAYRLQYFWRTMAEYQFGWLVVALSMCLISERWRNRPSPAVGSIWVPVILAASAVPFLLLAEVYRHAVGPTPFGSTMLTVGCGCVTAAILLRCEGAATLRHFAFPLLFLLLAMPVPGIVWQPFVRNLQRIVASLNCELLGFLGIPSMLQGTLIQLPNGTVGVDEACSGIRSLQSSAMAALFIGSVTLNRSRSKALLLFAGIGFAIAGNLVRATGLSWIAYHQGGVALVRYHDAAGWSILLFTALGLVLFSRACIRWETRPRIREGRL